jgi:hypothetical protein
MNLIKKMLLAGSFALVICGCKKTGPSPDNYITYKVNGVYKSMRPDASYLDDALLIEGGKIGGEDLLIFFNGYPAPGTYDLKDIDTASISYSTGTDIYDTILSRTGTLVITSYDTKHVSGTFEFKANSGTRTVTITEGKFYTKVDQLGYSSPSCDSTDACFVDTSIYGTVRGKLLQHIKSVRKGKLNMAHINK